MNANNGDTTVALDCFLGVCKVMAVVKNGIIVFEGSLATMAGNVNWTFQFVYGLLGVIESCHTWYAVPPLPSAGGSHRARQTLVSIPAEGRDRRPPEAGGRER